MTTGTRTVDNRKMTSTSCGSANIGFMSTKTWSGGDGKRGEEHGYTMNYSSSNDELISWQFSGYPQVYSGSFGSCFGFPSPPPLDLPSNLIADLVIKNEEKFKRHSFNAAVNIAELRESCGMIAETARTLAKSFIALRRGDASAALKALNIKPNTSKVRDVEWKLRDSAASAWLGMTYGWSPLISSVGDAAEAAAAQLVPRRTRVVSRFSVETPYPSSNLVTTVGSRKIGVNLIFKIEEEARYTSLQEFGFTSPELIAWEIMPYSFVVDWFFPIGNYLQARGTLSSLKGTFVQSVLDVSDASTTGLRNGYVLLSGRATQRYVKLERTTGFISQLPLPSPALKNPISLSHVTSALSLLQKAFGR